MEFRNVMPDLEFDLTQEDIRMGWARRADCCPVALALIRQGHKNVVVTGSYVICDGVNYLTCEKLRENIVNFDTREEMNPGHFTLKAV